MGDEKLDDGVVVAEGRVTDQQDRDQEDRALKINTDIMEDEQEPILPARLSANVETDMSTNKMKMDNMATEINNLSKDIAKLSVSRDHQHKDEPQGHRRLTAKSVIAKFEELRLKSPQHLVAHGSHECEGAHILVPHAPHSSVPARTAKKRGATDTDSSAIKYSRGKEPSEQDERVGKFNIDAWLNSTEPIFYMQNILSMLTDNKEFQLQLMDDISCIEPDNHEEFEKYLNNTYLQQPLQQIVPNSPHSPKLHDNPISPSSGYNTGDKGNHGSPYTYDSNFDPSSPTSFSDTTDYNVDSPQNNLANSEATVNIDDYCGSMTTEIPAQQHVHYPPANNITIRQMEQVHQVYILNGSIPQHHPQEQPTYPCQLPTTVQNGMSGVMISQGFQSQQNVRIAPQPTCAATNIGQLIPGNGCSCGMGSCQHRNIAPKNALSSSPPRPSSIIPQPIWTPPQIPGIDEIIAKLPREELICARRWVASIKTEDLKKSDKDGDLALHIVVAQYDFPKLIALLERCRREKIIDEVINKRNIRTQTLLFIAIVAAPSNEKAADMISILLEYNANPLINTVQQGSNSIDNRYCCPVHIVAHKGNSALPIMRRLLTRNTHDQLSVGCDSKKTALHYAALGNQDPSDQIVYELIRQGADINLKEGKQGRTPLHLLLLTRSVGLVKAVLQLAGVEKAKKAMRVTTFDGCTALHIAASLQMDVEEHKQLLKLLLTYGAEIGAKNSHNQRPVDLIPKEHRDELCSMLRANPNKHPH